MAGEAADFVSPRKRLARGALICWAILIYFFLFAPIILLILFSFNANRYGTLPITGWTLQWYKTAFSDYQIQDALKTTRGTPASARGSRMIFRGVVCRTSRMNRIILFSILLNVEFSIRHPL